jgi:hypothetical protein
MSCLETFGCCANFIVNGKPALTAKVGDVITFDIPGESLIHLEQFQDGRMQYNDSFFLPMKPYTLKPEDVGTFKGYAFRISSHAQAKLQLICRWEFVVTK